MGIIHHGAPTELILALKEASGIENFVETGTLVGDTAAWAANNFRRVVTIENESGRFGKAVQRFGGTPNVTVVFGNSPDILNYCCPSRSEERRVGKECRCRW